MATVSPAWHDSLGPSCDVLQSPLRLLKFATPPKHHTSFESVPCTPCNSSLRLNFTPLLLSTPAFKVSSSAADLLSASRKVDLENVELIPSHPASPRSFTHRVVLQPFPPGAGRGRFGADHRAGEMGA